MGVLGACGEGIVLGSMSQNSQVCAHQILLLLK